MNYPRVRREMRELIASLPVHVILYLARRHPYGNYMKPGVFDIRSICRIIEGCAFVDQKIQQRAREIREKTYDQTYPNLTHKRGPNPGSNCFEFLYRLRDGEEKKTPEVCKGHISVWGSHVNQMMRLLNGGLVISRKGVGRTSVRHWKITRKGLDYVKRYEKKHLARRLAREI